MLKKHTKHTGHAQLQLDYHYKTADFKKSKGEKNSFEKSQDSRRVLVFGYTHSNAPTHRKSDLSSVACKLRKSYISKHFLSHTAKQRITIA